MSCKVLVVLLVASVHILQVCCISYVAKEVNTKYVRPDNETNSSCPRLPCETLDYYASVSHCNNTQFILMPGLHTLSTNFTLKYLNNIAFIGMRDENKTSLHQVNIWCNDTVGFVFEHIKHLNFENLNIFHCGKKVSNESFDCSKELYFCQAAVAFKTVHTLTMVSVSIYKSYGYGFAADGLYGNSSIEECIFTDNAGIEAQFVGGNFIVQYEHCPEEYTREQINVMVRRSNFSRGYTVYPDSKQGTMQSRATGIALILLCTNINIHLFEVYLHSNKAFSYSSKGGNLFALLGNSYQYTSNSLTVENSQITQGIAKIGGGAYIRIRQPMTRPANTNFQCNNSIVFRNTNFTHNKGEIRGGAMYVFFEMVEMLNFCPKTIINVTSCYFQDNILITSKADSGVAINIYGYLTRVDTSSLLFYIVNISRCHFLRNKLSTIPANSLDQVTGGATVYVTKKRRETVIRDSRFENNSVPAISAFGSNIVFEGEVLIRNNSGIDGGGLVLCEASYILFSPHTTVTFERNSALLSGGGIYAEEQCLQSEPLCFYQINANDSLNTIQKNLILDSIHIVMIHNAAKYAGSQIFGGSIEYCYTTFHENNMYVYNKTFNETSWQVNKTNDPSCIASNPKHVCFCEKNKHICMQKSIDVSIYPGESLHLSLVAVGQFHNPVPATIIAYVSNSSTALAHTTIKEKCTIIDYCIKHPTENDTLNLIVSSGTGYTGGSHLRWVSIHYKHCPLGTYIENGQCYWKSDQYHFSATDQTVHRNGNGWVGYYNSSKYKIFRAGSGFIVYRYCPMWYCNNKTALNVSETYFDEDAQCNSRQGILCGACKEPRSLAIASINCIECEHIHNSYLLLLILGILAITVLVLLFMLCCNVTITDGTVNGFLFYVSIFNVNRDSLLRPRKTFPIFVTFISWINLDIGLDTCLFKGFNAFWQAVFNFCIPVFIWFIVGLLIYASSKSSKLTRLIGGNAVKVLATLILISYTKILKTEVAVLSCARIHYPGINGSSGPHMSHWLVDGNVVCWQGKHLILVVIGLLFGVLTFLYTLALLFIQPLQRNSHRRGLKWVAKLKPFFDAYTSPHVIHDRYRFWNGLLLLFRLVCTILFTITSTRNVYKQYVFTTACICVLIICLMSFFNGVYKTKWLYALNVSFYYNLTILSLVSFYSLTKDHEEFGNSVQDTATTVSVSITDVTIVLIVSYHVYKRLKEVDLLSRCWQKVKESQCWQAVLRYWNIRRVCYVRLPQEDLDGDREMDGDFDCERESDDEPEEQNREQDIEGNSSKDNY